MAFAGHPPPPPAPVVDFLLSDVILSPEFTDEILSLDAQLRMLTRGPGILCSMLPPCGS